MTEQENFIAILQSRIEKLQEANSVLEASLEETWERVHFWRDLYVEADKSLSFYKQVAKTYELAIESEIKINIIVSERKE